MFRGKESSNRIELSRLVQELLNFGVSGSLQLWGGVRGGWIGVRGGGGWVDRGGGWLEVPPTHVHMHAHVCVVNMIISCKWPPPLGESMGIPYDLICTCMCVHMCACVFLCMCVGGTTPHPHPNTHPPPRGGPPESVKIQ